LRKKEELKKEFEKEKNEFKIQLENKNVLNDTFFKLILENGDVMNRSDGYIMFYNCMMHMERYLKNTQNQDYINVLSNKTGISNNELIIDIQKGGIIQGTYVHRKLAYHLAQWISSSFSMQVSNVIYNLNK
jgi:hypothetical protein